MGLLIKYFFNILLKKIDQINILIYNHLLIKTMAYQKPVEKIRIFRDFRNYFTDLMKNVSIRVDMTRSGDIEYMELVRHLNMIPAKYFTLNLENNCFLSSEPGQNYKLLRLLDDLNKMYDGGYETRVYVQTLHQSLF